MASISHAERNREGEDAKIQQVAQILDVVEQAARYRRLMKEIEAPPEDILAKYRSMALQIFGAIESIAQHVIDRDSSERNYDDSLRS